MAKCFALSLAKLSPVTFGSMNNFIARRLSSSPSPWLSPLFLVRYKRKRIIDDEQRTWVLNKSINQSTMVLKLGLNDFFMVNVFLLKNNVIVDDICMVNTGNKIDVVSVTDAVEVVDVDVDVDVDGDKLTDQVLMAIMMEELIQENREL